MYIFSPKYCYLKVADIYTCNQGNKRLDKEGYCLIGGQKARNCLHISLCADLDRTKKKCVVTVAKAGRVVTHKTKFVKQCGAYIVGDTPIVRLQTVSGNCVFTCNRTSL